jgi:hypothetical protein
MPGLHIDALMGLKRCFNVFGKRFMIREDQDGKRNSEQPKKKKGKTRLAAALRRHGIESQIKRIDRKK